MIYNLKTKLYFFSISISIILLDQLTKYLIFYNYKLFINKYYIFFKLDYVKNYGAAFNLFSGSRLFLSGVSLIYSTILIYLILRKKTSNFLEIISYCFILGGSIGNGIDRVIKGYVIDFININILNFPVFNIADISINIGFILLLYSLFKRNR